MKKIFITTILFMLSLCVLAINDRDMNALLQYGAVDFAYGFKPSEGRPMNDFSSFYAFDLEKPYTATLWAPMEDIYHPHVFDSWFHLDFDEAPFDGRIEVLAVGQPLPSPGLTIALALCTATIIWLCRKQPKRT